MRHGGQPGCVKMTTFLAMHAKTQLPGSGLQIFSLWMHKSGNHTSSITAVIFAVLPSICDTEQYFSFDSRTASYTALRDTFPPTRYLSLMAV